MSALSRLGDPADRFILRLVAIALCAFGTRLLYGFSLDEPGGGDALWYHRVANGFADGVGFINPFLFTPTAAHPPLFPLLLSAVSFFGGTSLAAHQVAGCAFGAATALVVGLAGRRLAGPPVGLLAAGGVAIYLPLIANDSLLMSESVYGLTVALVLLAALRMLDRPSRWRALTLGLAIGLATLARAEALLLVVLLGVPVVMRAEERDRWPRLAIVFIGAVLVVSPWTARNWSVFDRPVLVSTNNGSVIAGANCETTYGRYLGQWDFGCLRDTSASGVRLEDEVRALRRAVKRGTTRNFRRSFGNEAVQSALEREHGLRYARDHLDELPKVVAARIGRTWSLYRPQDQINFDRAEHGASSLRGWLTLFSYGAAAALALVGALLLRRRHGPVIVLAAPVVLVTVTSALGFGTPRFRQAAEISIVLLGSVAAADGLAALRRRLGRASCYDTWPSTS
jgi:4-amino-4-deoxy-L-arabinose transferase-like glycosyltransferase